MYNIEFYKNSEMKNVHEDNLKSILEKLDLNEYNTIIIKNDLKEYRIGKQIFDGLGKYKLAITFSLQNNSSYTTNIHDLTKEEIVKKIIAHHV